MSHAPRNDVAAVSPDASQDAGAGAVPLTRSSAFSYECRACGRCCHHKRIPLGPYDVLRLARHVGLTTGEFLRRHLDREGPWLAFSPDGSCAFLDDGHCTVHAARPFACRVYPLGRWVTADGEETFQELSPHPQSAGSYGRDGTVAEFLERQGAMPYIAAADLIQKLFYRLFHVLQEVLPQQPDLLTATPEYLFNTNDPNGQSGFAEWLDVDRIAVSYHLERGQAVPDAIETVLQSYVAALDAWLTTTEGEST